MQCQYFFDFLSPYSYLSWVWVRDNRQYLQERTSIALRPVTMANIIHHHGGLGPAEIAVKREYLMKDCLRFSALHDIPFNPPAQLPFNSLYALRLSLFETSGADQWKIIDLFFRAAWELGLDIGKEQVVKDILSQNHLPQESLMERIFSKEIRVALKENVKEAISQNVFGVPTFVLSKYDESRKELFWGNESINYLKMYLENNDPLNLDKFAKMKKSYVDTSEINK